MHGKQKRQLEKELEAKLCEKLESLGAMALKFVSPGKAGVPDRLVLIPYGHIAFVELKRPGEKLRPLQAYTIQKIKARGFPVFIIDGEKSLNDFLSVVRGWMRI